MQVVVFGSVVKGGFTASSDIDLLIVSDGIPVGAVRRAELKKSIEELAGLPAIHPVEIHLATRREVEVNPVYREAIREGVVLRLGCALDEDERATRRVSDRSLE